MTSSGRRTLRERDADSIADQALTEVENGLVSDADVAPFQMW